MRRLVFLLLLVLGLLPGCGRHPGEVESIVVEVMDHPGGLLGILRRHARTRDFHDWLIGNVVIAEEVGYLRSFEGHYTMKTFELEHSPFTSGAPALVVQVMKADGSRQLEFYFSGVDEGAELLGWKPLVFWG